MRVKTVVNPSKTRNENPRRAHARTTTTANWTTVVGRDHNPATAGATIRAREPFLRAINHFAPRRRRRRRRGRSAQLKQPRTRIELPAGRTRVFKNRCQKERKNFGKKNKKNRVKRRASYLKRLNIYDRSDGCRLTVLPKRMYFCFLEISMKFTFRNVFRFS